MSVIDESARRHSGSQPGEASDQNALELREIELCENDTSAAVDADADLDNVFASSDASISSGEQRDRALPRPVVRTSSRAAEQARWCSRLRHFWTHRVVLAVQPKSNRDHLGEISI